MSKGLGEDEKIFIIDIETHIWDGSARKTNPYGEKWMANNEARCARYKMVSSFDNTKFTLDGKDDHSYTWEIFALSETTMACTCSLDLRGLFNGRAIAEPEVQAEAQRKYPDRCIAAGILGPAVLGEKDIKSGKTGLEYIEYQIEELGIRAWGEIYQSRFRPDMPRGKRVEQWRLDDEKRVYPILEMLVEKDAPLLLCHKGPTGWYAAKEWARPYDVDVAAKNFPELSFIIYHWAGRDYDVAAAIAATNENVWVGCNWKTDHLRWYPKRWVEAFCHTVFGAGIEKVVWGTDWPSIGPMQFQIEALKAVQVPSYMRHDYGYRVLTWEDKRKIFGLNMAGVLKHHNFINSVKDQMKRAENDKFSQHLATVLPRLKKKYQKILLESHPWWKNPDNWMEYPSGL